MVRKIEIVVYQPLWPQLFEDEATLIQNILKDNCITVHHIGSTSVPGLASKPIIDILVVVKDIEMASQMENLGYESFGEYGIKGRRYFQKGNDQHTHHVHIFEKDNPEIKRHLLFRDWLRNHPEDCKKYEKLKNELAQKFPHDIESYCRGKNAFISAIEHWCNRTQ